MSPGKEKKLSPDEMDALLENTEEMEEQQAGDAAAESERRVETYDFLQPSRFKKVDLDNLRRLNSNLAHRAAEPVSRLMGYQVRVQLLTTDQMKWQYVLDEAGDDQIGYSFEMPPLPHRGTVTMDRTFATQCLDQMLGEEPGSGDEEIEREFTDLESRIFGRFVRCFVDPLSDLWDRIGDFDTELKECVNDLQSVDLYTGNQDMFQLSLLVQADFGSGQLAISVPFEAVRDLPPSSDEQQETSQSDERFRKALRDSLQKARVELSVLLGKAEISSGRLLQLEPDDIVMLDTTIEDPLEIKINNKVKAHGYPGVSKGRFAIKLIQD